ncbi:hypothetical protein EVAR_71962_1 [Eumeta japonica]|uniref:Uncharacterized protein n=1 Tax=Eumeta variegata TaxID=151549 RepID=A0A4C1TDR0_EUMVA|nr:hypothetical protein EVAR_71962_1 [Eumeta japonica]
MIRPGGCIRLSMRIHKTDNYSLKHGVGSIYIYICCRVTAFYTVQRTTLCRSKFPANGEMRRFIVPQSYLLLPRVPILRYCDAFVTNFTAAENSCVIAYVTERFARFLLVHTRTHNFIILVTEFQMLFMRDEFCDGRLSTAADNINIDAVRLMIETDRHVTYHEAQTSISIDSRKGRQMVWDIVKDDETWINSYDLKTKQQSTLWVYRDEPKSIKVNWVKLEKILKAHHRSSHLAHKRLVTALGLCNRRCVVCKIPAYLPRVRIIGPTSKGEVRRSGQLKFKSTLKSRMTMTT